MKDLNKDTIAVELSLGEIHMLTKDFQTLLKAERQAGALAMKEKIMGMLRENAENGPLNTNCTVGKIALWLASELEGNK